MLFTDVKERKISEGGRAAVQQQSKEPKTKCSAVILGRGKYSEDTAGFTDKLEYEPWLL